MMDKTGDIQATGENAPLDLPRRTWCYVQRPAEYEMAPCACGNADPDWSEFQDRLWCSKCQIDFVPEHAGLFDGPVSVEVCRMIGIVFDRVVFATGQVERFPWTDEANATPERTGRSP